jgi:hypothetical protein
MSSGNTEWSVKGLGVEEFDQGNSSGLKFMTSSLPNCTLLACDVFIISYMPDGKLFDRLETFDHLSANSHIVNGQQHTNTSAALRQNVMFSSLSSPDCHLNTIITSLLPESVPQLTSKMC